MGQSQGQSLTRCFISRHGACWAPLPGGGLPASSVQTLAAAELNAPRRCSSAASEHGSPGLFPAACGLTSLLGVAALAGRRRPRGLARVPRGAPHSLSWRGVAQRARGGHDSEDPRVPVVLLTGFLGTGKTTLLKHWLENSEGRIGVVVNDVAAVNIDAKLVDQQKANAKGEVDTIQLQNGCACCSLGDELLLTIYDLMQLAEKGRPFSQIVVELSGVAEPKRVRENFERAEISRSEIVEGMKLSKVVTLMDSSTFCTDYMEYSRLFERPDLMEPEAGELAEVKVVELLVEQLEDADVVVMNKTDLADEETLAATRAVVGALNDKASVCETSFGRVPLSAVLAEPATAAALEDGRGHGHEDSPGHESAHAHDEARGHEEHGHKVHGHGEAHGHEEHGHEAHGHSEAASGHSHGHEQHGHSHDCSDPECDDPSHGHTHGHSATTAEDRFGITSFTYAARRPFHADRLAEVLQKWPVPKKDCLGQMLSQPPESGHQSPFSRVIRSKGFCWLESYPSSRMYWSHAGKNLVLEFDNFWYGALPEEQLQVMESFGDYARTKREDWTDEWADRRQEIVFIGQKMDEPAIRELLDECLLREGEELDAYRKRQEDDSAMSNMLVDSGYD